MLARQLLSIPRSLLAFIAGCLLATVSMSSNAQTAVYLRADTPDPVGRQLAFELREALRRSAGLTLAERPKDARIFTRIVTLDPLDGSSSGYSTVYSAVITFQTFHDTPIEMYLTNYVGTCGRNRVSNCAQSLLAGIDEQASSIRALLRDVLETQRK
jgi:hypothetical protein